MSDWDTGNSASYSLDKFYVHSRDKYKNKGSAKVIGLPENILGEIAAAIASQRFPYRTQADFIRDACVHRAQWLADNKEDPKLKAAVAKDLVEQSIHNKRESMQKEETAVEEIIESLHNSDPVDVDEIVMDGREYLQMMKWSKYKSKLRVELDRFRPEPE